ncbi:hypothetical protein ACFS07_36190 [Undibacterium arcticum]
MKKRRDLHRTRSTAPWWVPLCVAGAIYLVIWWVIPSVASSSSRDGFWQLVAHNGLLKLPASVFLLFLWRIGRDNLV